MINLIEEPRFTVYLPKINALTRELAQTNSSDSTKLSELNRALHETETLLLQIRREQIIELINERSPVDAFKRLYTYEDIANYMSKPSYHCIYQEVYRIAEEEGIRDKDLKEKKKNAKPVFIFDKDN